MFGSVYCFAGEELIRTFTSGELGRLSSGGGGGNGGSDVNNGLLSNLAKLILHVCSYGGFGYAGREVDFKLFGAKTNAEAVAVVGYDSQEGGAHGSVWAGGLSLPGDKVGISGGIEVSRTWRDWQEHREPIVFPADRSGHAPTIGGIKFADHVQGGPLVQYANGQLSIGGYLGGVKGTLVGGGGGYVNLSWKPCPK
jgi:hypothetical protein